ncbi:MAG: FAD-dependent oxidoreductase [Alphaproteobacteria bacterium]|nr:FAD-dependent oxidoreductase [Alphaproteobacteria bacterium]
MSGLTRADFLRGAGAVAASGLLPARAADPRGTEAPLDADVVVIGGGLSGLTAARELGRRGHTSLVLEARDRVGGRTLSVPTSHGHPVDGGGAWIGPGQDRMAALAVELGLVTVPSWYAGDTTYDLLGKVTRGMIPDVSWSESLDALRALWRLDRLAGSLPQGASWEAADAARLDALTVHDWLVGRGATPFTHAVFKLITRAVFAGHPEHMSLLWVLHYVGAAGGVLPVILNDGGAQDLRFEGGSQQVSLGLAALLGDVVRLAHPVRHVEQPPGEPVRVHTDGGVLRCRRVVVAMMPGDTMRIAFTPELPAARLDLAGGWARLTRLPLIKTSVLYPRPFWRDRGLSGAMQSDAAPLQLVFDTSPTDGSLGVLTCFLSVTEAPHLGDARTRPQAVAEELVRYFGPDAAHPLEVVEKDWGIDPWSTGCITPLPPGLLSRAGHTLRTPVDRVHWAGTETAHAWCGYMEGAVRAGERVAAEVHAALDS